MDESLKEFEAELKAFSLRRPSSRLFGEIENDLRSPVVMERMRAASPHVEFGISRTWWKWLSWGTAGLVATLILLGTTFSLWGNRASKNYSHNPANAKLVVAPSGSRSDGKTGGANEAFRPVAASNILYDLKDEGLVKIDHNTSAHRVRYRYLDTYTWKNPRSNASLKWSVPRDEIRMIPVNLN